MMRLPYNKSVAYCMCKEHPQSLFVMLDLLLDTLWETKIAIENGPGINMYFLLKTRIFHCYVSLHSIIIHSYIDTI